LRHVDLAEFGPATVLIGPNGSGKSNLLAALRMVRMLAHDSLQLFVGTQGGAGFLMHYGPSVTPVIDIDLEFAGDQGDNAYACRLGHAAGDSLVFLDERAGFRRPGATNWNWTNLGAGHRESRLAAESERDTTARSTRWLLRRLNFYHFHDTSHSAELRSNARREDDRYLRSNGSNLAAFLIALKQSDDEVQRAAYRRIEALVRQIAPFIRELEPTPTNGGAVRLDWIDDRQERFGTAHLSDGTLRAIALFTALGQPVEFLPLLCAIDEPELGLHPAALHLLCELVRSASAHSQVLLATQSPALLDQFNASEVIIAEREDSATQFRRLDETELAEWLRDYSLSELYDTNVLGGRP
jgi:predicted ATPase